MLNLLVRPLFEDFWGVKDPRFMVPIRVTFKGLHKRATIRIYKGYYKGHDESDHKVCLEKASALRASAFQAYGWQRVYLPLLGWCVLVPGGSCIPAVCSISCMPFFLLLRCPNLRRGRSHHEPESQQPRFWWSYKVLFGLRIPGQLSWSASY